MMDLYDEWNLLLLNEYFNEANRGESVWIQTSREELDSFGFRYGGADGLIKAVKLGPSWCRSFPSQITYTVWVLYTQRQSERERPADYGDPGNYSDTYKDLEAPTYLPYLALWVLAASEEGGIGFYDKVAQLSGAYFESSEDTRRTIWWLWKDLADWSNLLDGELGKFSAISLGRHAYVGLAKAQALLTQRDRRELPRLFVQQGLRPNQKLSDSEFRNLTASGQDQYFLSNGLREAFGNKVFREAVREVLNARLAEWDGSWSSESDSRSSRQNNSAARRGFEDTSPDEILPLSVLLSQQFEGWELGFRINTHLSGNQFKLECFGEDFTATIDSYRDTTDCLNNSESGQLAVWAALEHALKGKETILEATYSSDTDDNSEISVKTKLSSVVCRSLAWTNTQHEQKLVEVPLPIVGPVYLLTTDESVKHTLTNYEINHLELVEENRIGMPENWQIFIIEDAESLTPRMRSAIQRLTGDQSGAKGRPRIRFVSGCVIMRGGSRQFVDYDLPLVEVEMPKGAEVKSEGLLLENIEAEKGWSTTYSELYRIERKDLNLYQYTINVILRSEILCSAKLKIAPSLVHVHPNREFSIGEFGDALNSEDGLKGTSLQGSGSPELESNSVDLMTDKMWKAFLPTPDLLNPRNNMACLFLNLIAQKGSIPIGDAKRLLSRLAQRLSIESIIPISVLFSLRSLGYIDIETDQKGHLVRVHAAPPAIYRLAYDDPDGTNCWSVGGTLTLEQWESVVTKPDLEVLVTDSVVPSVRISSNSIQAIVEELRVNLSFGVSDRILDFSASLDGSKARLLSQHKYGQFRSKNLQRLNPQKAYFSSDHSGLMKVDADRSCELFKLDDPVVSKMQVYMLGNYGEAGSVYSFIPDSRWAVWMAIISFGEMYYQKEGRDEAYPWPLCYLADSADLIIPARMQPPMLIDRALCLASGQLPDVVRCKVKGGSEGEGGFTIYSESNNAFNISNVPWAYYAMADGKWLRYRLVPKTLAEKVAQKLSCDVHYVS